MFLFSFNTNLKTTGLHALHALAWRIEYSSIPFQAPFFLKVLGCSEDITGIRLLFESEL